MSLKGSFTKIQESPERLKHRDSDLTVINLNSGQGDSHIFVRLGPLVFSFRNKKTVSRDKGVAPKGLPLLATAVCALALSACSTAADDRNAPSSVFDRYEPSTAHPFGQLNPDAPPEVAAYSFMVGLWDCRGALFQRGQDPVPTQSRVRGQYYLNGFGYINHTYQTNSVGVMTYVYDMDSGAWVVDYTAAPSPAHSRWGAVDIDEPGALASQTPAPQDGAALRSVFYEIGEKSFRWRLDFVTADGVFTVRKSTCSRNGSRGPRNSSAQLPQPNRRSFASRLLIATATVTDSAFSSHNRRTPIGEI